MNPYANAFSQLMSQFSTSSTPQNQQQGQQHQSGPSPPLPPYDVYIPGSNPQTTMQSSYPAQVQYAMPPMPPSLQPQYPYPMYQQYPGAQMYPPIHSQYLSHHTGHAYPAPTVYPMTQNVPHQAPSSFQPQGHTYQNRQHVPPKNHAKQYNKPMQKKHAVNPTTPSAAAASQVSPFSTSQHNTHNQPFSFPSSSEAMSGGGSSNIVPTSTASFFCEACDKEFPNQSTYNSHCSTHEMCSFPGCTFTASKRVVQAHFHSTHGLYSGQGYKDIDVEGQSFRVLLGTSPEEVAQWRAERRQKFPSSERASIPTSNDTTTATSNAPDNNSSSNNGPKGKKSLAAQKREEWKLKKQQQRLEKQHYKQLRNAHHGPNHANDSDPTDDDAQPSRNFIQIKSQTIIKGVNVSTVEGADNAEEVTSIRLPPSSNDNEEHPAKRTRFDPSIADKSPQKQRPQKQSRDKTKKQPNNNSLLRKPDISGNLLAKLLLNEIRAEENLFLQSIRFLRQVYDPRCQVPEQVTTTTAPSTDENSKLDEETNVTNLSSEEKQKLIQQLTTMDIDALITEAHNAPDDPEEGVGEFVVGEDEEEDNIESDVEDEEEQEEGEVKENEEE